MPGQTGTVLPDADGYGDAFADVYDAWYGASFDTEGAVAQLIHLAGTGPALELGVGTGRLALPLAAAGVLVVGVDASAAMLARVAAKVTERGANPVTSTSPAGAVIPVLADMADVAAAIGDAAAPSASPIRAAPPVPTAPPRHPPVPSDGYQLVFCAANTFFNLHTEPSQERCLAGVAALLAPDGAFVLEAFVPAAPEDVPRTSMDVAQVRTDAVVLTCTDHDPAAQVVVGQHVELRDGTVRLRPWRLRYLSPAQLDAMASAAGLVLTDRFADWRRTPFGDDSQNHVSVYRRRPESR